MEFNEGYARDIIEIAERSKSNSHRLDDVEKDVKTLQEEHRALYEISANMKILTEGVVNIKDDVKTIKSEQGEMKTQISDLRNAPDKKKGQFVDYIGKLIITAVATAVIAYTLGALSPTLFG